MKITIEITGLKPANPTTQFDIPTEQYGEVHEVIADTLSKDIEASLNSHPTLMWMNEDFHISIESE